MCGRWLESRAFGALLEGGGDVLVPEAEAGEAPEAEGCEDVEAESTVPEGREVPDKEPVAPRHEDEEVIHVEVLRSPSLPVLQRQRFEERCRVLSSFQFSDHSKDFPQDSKCT